jgi:hypothetical protein
MVWRAPKLCLLLAVVICPALKSAAQSNSPITVVCSNAPRVASLKAPAAAAGSEGARGWLFGPPAYCWLNLPFKTDSPAADKTLQSRATGNQLHSSIEERHQARIEQLVREGSLKLKRPQRNLDDEMSRIQSIDANVSFDHEHINILNTILR